MTARAPSGRLAAAFARPRPKLVVYLTCGDPSDDTSVALVVAAATAGADVIELGVPFSDPSADGPAIQRAMSRALRSSVTAGSSLDRTLEVARRARAAGVEVPLVLFGYYNPIFVRGVDAACEAAADAGIDGLLVVDLPTDEVGELAPAARAAGLGIVPLCAPTTTAARMREMSAVEPPFVYVVSMTGITGAALADVGEVGRRLAEVRTHVATKVAVGFGISTPEDAKRLAAHADAVVIGSVVVRAIEASPGREAQAVSDLVAGFRTALDAR